MKQTMNSKKTILLIGACLFLAVALARSYSIDGSTLGGGGMATGGVYSVSGTIGQPDAFPALSSANFSLAGGFWPLVAVQTPAAPLLRLSRDSSTTFIVSWPSPSAGFTLQETTLLGTTNWIDSSATVTDSGTNKFISVSPLSGILYFRLFKP